MSTGLVGRTSRSPRGLVLDERSVVRLLFDVLKRTTYFNKFSTQLTQLAQLAPMSDPVLVSFDLPVQSLDFEVPTIRNPLDLPSRNRDMCETYSSCQGIYPVRENQKLTRFAKAGIARLPNQEFYLQVQQKAPRRWR